MYKDQRAIKTFKSPSSITFALGESEYDGPMISHAERGQTFLRDGAICVRVDVSNYQGESDDSKRCKDIEPKAGRYWIHNLQTGRVWSSEDKPIEWIKITMTVDSSTK